MGDVSVAVAFFHEEDNQAKLAFETAVSNFDIMDSPVEYVPRIEVTSESDSLEHYNTCEYLSYKKKRNWAIFSLPWF